MVECQLPKLDVAGSSPVSRSIFQSLAVLPKSELPLFEVKRQKNVRNVVVGNAVTCFSIRLRAFEAELQRGAQRRRRAVGWSDRLGHQQEVVSAPLA